MKRILCFLFSVLALGVQAQRTISPGGGGPGGSATNAIALLNGRGTNITLVAQNTASIAASFVGHNTNAIRLPTTGVSITAGMFLAINSDGGIFPAVPAGSSYTFDTTQISLSGAAVAIKSGVIVTNPVIRGQMTGSFVYSNASTTFTNFVVLDETGIYGLRANSILWQLYGWQGNPVAFDWNGAQSALLTNGGIATTIISPTQVGLKIRAPAANVSDFMQFLASDGTTKLFLVDSNGMAYSAVGANFTGALNIGGLVTLTNLTASRPLLTSAGKALVSGQIDLANANHVTGTLGVGNGGLGTASSPGAGILPVGNGSTYTLLQPSAHSFLTLTNNGVVLAWGVDITALTADATPDGAADYVITYDASAATVKKVLLNNLPTGGGGEANTAANLGGGYMNFDNKSGVSLRFNTMTNGNGLTVSSNLNTFTWFVSSTLNVGVFTATNSMTSSNLSLSGQVDQTVWSPALADIDWNRAVYALDIVVNTNLTFSNINSNRGVTLILTNRGAFTLTLPAYVYYPFTSDNLAFVLNSNSVTYVRIEKMGYNGFTNAYIAGAKEAAIISSLATNETDGVLVVTNKRISTTTMTGGGGGGNYVTNLNGTPTNLTARGWLQSDALTTNNARQQFNGPLAFSWVPVNSTIDWNTTNSQTITLSGNTTFTFANTNDGLDLVINIKQDATGGRTATWPSAIVWMNSTNQSAAPQINTNASQYSVVHFWEAAGLIYAEGPSWGPSTYVANLEAGNATADSTAVVPFKTTVPAAHLTNMQEWVQGTSIRGMVASNGAVRVRYAGTNIEHLAAYTAFVADQGVVTNITTTTNSIIGSLRRGSLTLPGSMWQENRAFYFSFDGKYWTGGTPGNCRYMINLNTASATNTIASRLFTPTASKVGDSWYGNFKLHCVTNSTTGFFQLTGTVIALSAGTATYFNITNVLSQIDTTVDYRFDFGMTNGAATDGFWADNAVGEVK